MRVVHAQLSNPSQAKTVEIPLRQDRATYQRSHPDSLYYPPPHTMESRSSIPPTLPDAQSATTMMRNEPSHGPVESVLTMNPRPQGQSLPGLRDILSSPTDSPHRPFLPSLNSPSTAQHNQDFARPVHPPMSLQSPARGPSAQPSHRYEQINGDIGQRRPSVHVSSYSNIHQPQAHEYSERRPSIHGHPTNGSYGPNGTSVAQFTNGANDPQAVGMPLAAPPASSALGPNGAEAQKKWIGVEKINDGMFYRYEDGSYIPTHVDGEQVNPDWGLTKANKPRKRLAQACLDCREKKIKCEPGQNSCLQCEKAKRPCRKAPTNLASETVTNSGAMVTTWPATPGPPNPNQAFRHDSMPTVVTLPLAGSETLTKRGPEEEGYRAQVYKKPRSGIPPIPSFGPRYDGGPNPTVQDQYDPYYPAARSSSMYSPSRGPLSLDDDPYAASRETTLHLLDLYFADLGSYSTLPHRHFMRWVTGSTKKGVFELTALYSILAFASVFSDDTYLKIFGGECASIASGGVLHRPGQANVCIAITRTMLGLFHFAKGNPDICWDHIGAGMSALTSLRLYTESGCLEGDKVSPFNFSRHQLAECKRRVYWSIFVLERLGAIPMCTLKPQDAFLRLPCSDDAYERGLASNAPFFDNDIIDESAPRLKTESPVSRSAWLVCIAAIQGEVLDFTHRASHRGQSTYHDTYEAFHAKTTARAQWWLDNLPGELRNEDANIDCSIQNGYAGIFVTMHTLHYHLVMLLNRCVKHSWLDLRSLQRNIRATNSSAHDILQIVGKLRRATDRVRQSCPGKDYSIGGLTSAFTGYTTLLAVDVISGGGWDWNIAVSRLEVLRAVYFLRDLSPYWISGKDQSDHARDRYLKMQNVIRKPKNARSGCWLGRRWGMEAPMIQILNKDYDCIYGLPDDSVFYEAFSNPTDAQMEQRDRYMATQDPDEEAGVLLLDIR